MSVTYMFYIFFFKGEWANNRKEQTHSPASNRNKIN